MKEFFLAYWPVLVVAIQMLLAVLVFWVDARTERKITSSLKPVENRLQTAESDIIAARDDIEELPTKVDIARLEGRMDEAERAIVNLPTKADLARVEGEVKGVGNQVQNVAAGIQRLEGYHLQRGFEKT